MKNKILIIVLVASLLAYIFYTVRSCSNNAYQAANWKARYDTAMSTIRVLKSRTGAAVTEQSAAVFVDPDATKKASAAGFNLPRREERKIKRVDTYVQADQAFVVQDDSIDLKPMASINDRFDSIAVPQKFRRDSSAYFIAGTVTKGYVVIDSLAIYNTMRLRVAEKSRGLFRPNETVVQVTNSNPLIVTTGMTSMTLKPKTKAWNRWLKPFLVGAAGVYVGTQIR